MGKNQRSQITMSDVEVEAFLRDSRSMTMATIGPAGRPHLVAMWYGLVDGAVTFETKAKTQKVQNLRRNPKVSVMLEAGELYHELRGLVIEGDAAVVEGDVELAARVATMSGSRRPAEPPSGPPSEQTVRAVAKRVVVRVHPVRVYSWDHRKLGGTY